MKKNLFKFNSLLFLVAFISLVFSFNTNKKFYNLQKKYDSLSYEIEVQSVLVERYERGLKVLEKKYPEIVNQWDLLENQQGTINR